jgi:hypothetical protein
MRRFAIALLAVIAASGQKKVLPPPPPVSPPQSTASDGAAGQISNAAAEKAQQVIVMINAAIEGDTRPGAGIIFGLANDRVYIATANHLVRRGTSNASDIQVEFKWSPGEQFAAELLTYYDTALDLAVIVVRGLAKTGADRVGLPLDRLGNPSSLAQGVRGDPVWAIGYPNGTAYDVSEGQVGQVEAVVLTYRVPGLVPGGYSGGPVVDRNGLIVGMIRRDQPPTGEATRIDLVVNQLRAWGYQVALHSPASGPPGTTRSQARPDSAGADAFRDTLLRYVHEAPSGFVALGAANKIGAWVPAVSLPNAISCQGRGHSQSAFIECVLASEKNEVDADLTFNEVVEVVQAALPGWKNSQMNFSNWSFFDGRTNTESTVSVVVSFFRSGTGYDVTLSVYR